MALPNNTTISLGQVNTELTLSATAAIAMNDVKVRALAGIMPPASSIAMNNLWNKSYTLPVTSSLYAWYDYASWDNTNKIWYDKVNTYHAASTGAVTTSSVSGNGSSVTINTVYVPTAAGIQWPTQVLPATYTMFHLCRYNGTYNGRIIQGMTKNWLDGFWAGNSGQAYHEGWLTNTSTNYEGNNWVVSASQDGLYRSNGTQRSTGVGGNTYDRIGINAGTIYAGEASDAHVVEVLVYNRELDLGEIMSVESYFNTKYSIASYPGGISNGLLAWYDYASYNSSTGAWADKTGNGYTATASVSVSATSSTAGSNGSTSTFNCLQCNYNGGNYGKIVWPVGIVPSTYTLFHVCRYTGTSNNRIIQGKTQNWLSGFWQNDLGNFYHNGWISGVGGHGTNNNWRCTTDQNNLGRQNGTTYGTSGAGSPSYDRICINDSGYESSECQIAELIVYNTTLNGSEYGAVELYLTSKYGI